MGVGKGKGASAPLPPDFKLMLLCVLVTAKEHPKFAVMEKQEKKKKQL